MDQGTKVSQDNSWEVNRIDGTSSSGHFAMNAKDDIWVIVMTHQDAIIVGKLAI